MNAFSVFWGCHYTVMHDSMANFVKKRSLHSINLSSLGSDFLTPDSDTPIPRLVSMELEFPFSLRLLLWRMVQGSHLHDGWWFGSVMTVEGRYNHNWVGFKVTP